MEIMAYSPRMPEHLMEGMVWAGFFEVAEVGVKMDVCGWRVEAVVKQRPCEAWTRKGKRQRLWSLEKRTQSQ